MKLRFVILLVIWAAAATWSTPLVAQTPICGVLPLDLARQSFGTGEQWSFAGLTVPADTTLTIEITTTVGAEMTGILVIDGVGEVAYADNHAFIGVPTLVLSYYFPEATSGVKGTVLWQHIAAENTANVSLECAETTGAASAAQNNSSDETAAILAPLAADAPLQPLAAVPVGTPLRVDYAGGVRIMGRDANGALFLTIYMPPATETAKNALNRKNGSVRLAGDSKRGYAIYRAANGRVQVITPARTPGRAIVTEFNGFEPTETNLFQTTLPR
jgi:hypothetical protein